MNELQYLNVSYIQWKNMRTFLGGTTNGYYVSTSEGYTLVLVDLPRKFITVCHIKNGNPEGPDNILDFETNLKDFCSSQSSIDDCIVAVLILG